MSLRSPLISTFAGQSWTGGACHVKIAIHLGSDASLNEMADPRISGALSGCQDPSRRFS